MMLTDHNLPRVIIVGGGFAGLNAAKGLAGVQASLLLLDRTNHHLFQPLLYQVATSVLSPSDIASPIRQVLSKQSNVQVALSPVDRVDLENRRVCLPHQHIDYDYLVLAAGATHSYFSHDTWPYFAPGLKTVEDALKIRNRVLLAYEEAEWETDYEARRAKLTFVVVGGGPTGVELAGTLKEIAAHAIPRDFRFIDTTTARVILIEAGSRLLPAMPEESSRSAQRQLERMGVEVRLNCPVTDFREGEVELGEEILPAANIIWAAGVRGAPLAQTLGVALDKAGRVPVNPDLSLPGHPEVFVAGDLAHAVESSTQKPVPGVAPAAIQMGRHVAKIIRSEIEAGGRESKREPFQYRDKGTMATIGRCRAVASVKGFKAQGLVAWLLWSLVHIWSLIGFRKRVFVFFSWLWSYFVYSPKARIITGKSDTCSGSPDRRIDDSGGNS
ncbi:MAG: NAD(P)/FAD-dependent oxidoreductase [Thermodesulfobacteriota bacterium]|jgi:NADH dehydrogenase|nr:NAD(P)/FAD-dependent oxidoreductase [Thermodesulfobacteriota bacterium]